MKIYTHKNVINKTILLMFMILSFPSFVYAEDNGLVNLSGVKQKIEDYQLKNKWLIVMIWASDCHICNQEASNYEALYQSRKDKDINLLGLSIDGLSGIDKARNFVKRHNLTFPNLIGENSTISQHYYELTDQFLAGTPAFLIYDKNGVLVAAQIGAVPVSLIETFILESTG